MTTHLFSLVDKQGDTSGYSEVDGKIADGPTTMHVDEVVGGGGEVSRSRDDHDHHEDLEPKVELPKIIYSS